jgi:hypothetical protein
MKFLLISASQVARIIGTSHWGLLASVIINSFNTFGVYIAPSLSLNSFVEAWIPCFLFGLHPYLTGICYQVTVSEREDTRLLFLEWSI